LREFAFAVAIGGKADMGGAIPGAGLSRYDALS
jgi:hypothetical protein